MGVHEEDLVWLAARVRQINAAAGGDSGKRLGAVNNGQAAAAGAQEAERDMHLAAARKADRHMHAAAGAQEAEKDMHLAAAREGCLAAPDAAFVRTENGIE